MKLIKPSFEIIEQKPRDIVIPADMEIGPRMCKDELINSVYRQIEIAGRTCYRSESKITEGSAKGFVDRMVKSGHGAMLEHGTVYLKCKTEVINRCIHPEDGEEEYFNELEKYEYNSYSVTNDDGEYLYVTTNLRVLVENDWLDDLQYLCEPTEHHVKRITVKFICDRGVSHEFVRHRVFSFAQESTRYCNYSKNKFGNECTFIIPSWLVLSEGGYKWEDQNPLLTAGLSTEEAGYDDSSDLWLEDSDGNFIECKRHYLNWQETETFMHSLQVSEQLYLELLDGGWKPQQARAVLPNSLKTELVMTGTIEQWEGFFKLRDAGSAHPQAYELAHPLHEEFIKRGYLK